MGKDPLAREELHAAMRMRQRNMGLRTRRRLRHGAVGHRRQGRRHAALQVPGRRPLGDRRLRLEPGAGEPAGLRGGSAQFKADGWKAYKIHPPHPASEDIKVCEAVRKAVGDGYHADAQFDLELPLPRRAARRPRHRAAGLPLVRGPAQRGGHLFLREAASQKLDIPILATEYPAGDIGTYAVWLTERATDYLRGDIPVKGGLTTMLKTAHLAEAFHMTYEVHHGGNSLNNMAQLHFACAIPNTTYFEVLLPHGAHKYGLLNDIEIGKDGLAHCPQVPGIGAEFDFDLIKRKQIAAARLTPPQPRRARFRSRGTGRGRLARSARRAAEGVSSASEALRPDRSVEATRADGVHSPSA